MRRAVEKDDDKRGGILPRADRIDIRLEVIGKAGRGAPAIFELVNISRRGMLLRGPSQLALGDRLQVVLPGGMTAEASVVWSDDRLAGCSFAHDIPSATVKRVKLQGRSPSASSGPHQEALAGAELGLRLARYREDRGLSLDDLARQLDVSRQAVWFWETGRSNPRPKAMQALSRLLNPGEPGDPGKNDHEDVGRRLAQAKSELAELLGVSPRAIRIFVEH